MKLLTPTKPITPFTGKPAYQQTAKPSFMAQVRNGYREPRDVLDVILFGTPENVKFAELTSLAMDKIMEEK